MGNYSKTARYYCGNDLKKIIEFQIVFVYIPVRTRVRGYIAKECPSRSKHFTDGHSTISLK